MVLCSSPAGARGSTPFGSCPLKDSSRRVLCEKCKKPLVKCKGKVHSNPTGDKIGQICEECHDIHCGKRRPRSAPSSLPVAPPASKKRRATSDPGQQIYTEDRYMNRDWDPTPAQIAARRPEPRVAAYLAAEEAEWAARTPAQWARRHYLLHVASRCEQCNFPRTGKKGWDEKNRCHTDKDCNDNRWRVLDAFC